MSDYLDSDEMLKDFYLEAEQQVEQLEQNILAMENDPNDRDAIDEIFRAAHTLKGGASTVRMTELAEFTHAVEDLLDGIRSGTCQPTSDIIDALLQGLDVVKAMLEERQNGGVYNKDETELKNKLRSYVNSGSSSPAAAPVQKPASSPATAASKEEDRHLGESLVLNSGPSVSINDHDVHEMKELQGAAGKVFRVRVEFDEENPMNSVGGIQVFSVLKNFGQVLRTWPDFDSLYEDNFYPFVDYYILSTQNSELIEEKSSLSDVTLNVHAKTLDELDFSGSAIPVASPAQQGFESAPSAAALMESPAPAVAPTPAVQAPAVSSETAPTVGKPPKKGASAHKKDTSSQILKVDSKRIDTLLNLVSETVITKGAFNQVLGQLISTISSFQNVKASFNSSIKNLLETLPELINKAAREEEVTIKDVRKAVTSAFGNVYGNFELFEGSMKNTSTKIKGVATDLSRTTGELHEGVLKIRMVPVDQVFQRFPRLVRDLSKSLDKEVRLEIIGGDTEMDKTVTEELFDPLMHCVRNSMDHGIETPDDREAKGKNREGSLVLKASNQGNMVVIEITDDGNGINVEAIKTKAIERGLIMANKIISDQEAFNLIMEPGFSTAKQITNISGRGVGLDVVKKSIEKLNGEISIWSEYGHGSTFTIKLPLTLAIIQGLMVSVDTNIYAIPITSVLESFRIQPSEVRILDGYEVFNVRDDVVSILRLGDLFGIKNRRDQEYHFIVVVGSEEKKIGLMVDALIGEEDVVIKPLKDQYSNSPGIAGATILGDGTVSLIVDVAQLLTLGLKKEMLTRQMQDSTELIE